MVEAVSEYHDRIRSDVLPLVSENAGRILDMGGGIGATSAALLAAGRADEVMLVDQVTDVTAPGISRKYSGDLDDPQLLDRVLGECAPFDTILRLDILEHLRDPWRVVRQLHGGLAPGGAMVISLPNMNHLSLVLPLVLRGRFDLEDAGLRDRTHLRWFTRSGAIALATSSGLVVEACRPNIFRRRHRLLNNISLRLFERFFALQYVVRARRPAS